MRLSKVFLGSAAVLLALGGAHAADIPVKAKAIEYVKVCSLYGAGFYYLPGTDTCIKLGGYIRTDIYGNSNSNGGNTGGAGGAQNRFTNGYTWRSRADLNIDTRTATEYGVVRTFFDAVYTWTSGTYSGQAGGSSLYEAIGTAAAPNNASSGAVSAGTVGVYFAFVQFAGFTMGKAVSQFSTPWMAYPGNNFDGLVGGSNSNTGVNQFTYTADFGQGITAAISVQDQVAYFQAGLNNVNAGGLVGSSNYAGTMAPDIVGMIRIDQAWGLFQASLALHDNHAAYYGGDELSGHPQDKWGWAAQLGLQLKDIPTGPGDDIKVSGVYTNGATRYNIQDQITSSGNITMFGNTSLPGAFQSVGYGYAPDSVYGGSIANGTATAQQLVSTWGFRGAYTHNWDAHWNTSLYGAYAAISYNDAAKGLICGNYAGSFGAKLQPINGARTCNPDYSIGQIGLITRWTPVKNLTFSAEFVYSMLDQNMVGTIDAGSASTGKPTGVSYELKNQNAGMLFLRAQRTW